MLKHSYLQRQSLSGSARFALDSTALHTYPINLYVRPRPEPFHQLPGMLLNVADRVEL
jgi:hypothetical protein